MKKIIYIWAMVLVMLALLLQSKQANSQWVQMSNGMGTNRFVQVFTALGNNIFAGTDSGTYRSTNNGSEWTSVNNGLIYDVMSFAISGNNIIAGTGSGVYLSTNNGDSWTAKGLASCNIRSLTVMGTKIFAGVVGGGSAGVFISTDNCETWTQSSLTNAMVLDFMISGTNLFAGTWIGGVYRTTNGGNSWNAVNSGLPIQYGATFAANGTNIYVSMAPGGVFRSTNNGGNWSIVNSPLDTLIVYSFASSGNNIFAGTTYGGIFLSTNNCGSWIRKNQGFNPNPSVSAILITNNYIFAGADYQSVWRRSLSEIIGIQNISTETPSAFSLSQNYPNPFNPVTRIKYNISSIAEGIVTLKVYDVLGKEIETLVNEKQSPGVYEVTFDGTRFASGVYFYRLTAEGYGETKRMTLIK